MFDFLKLSMLPLLSALALPSQEVSVNSKAKALELTRVGISLHDQSRFSEAVAIYERALEIDPTNPLVIYELSLSLNATGSYSDCSRAAQRALPLTSDPRLRNALFVVGANCLDHEGDSSGAIKLYRKGLRENPESASLHYNLGLAYAQRGKLKHALESLRSAVRSHYPTPSAHWALAMVYSENGDRVPAVLAALRFLASESYGPRAAATSRLFLGQFFLGLKQESESAWVLTVGEFPPRTEGDLGVGCVALSEFAAWSKMAPDAKTRTETESLIEATELFLGFVAEGGLSDQASEFLSEYYLSFVARIVKAGHARALAYLALASQNPPSSKEWEAAHAPELRAFREFLALP